MKPYDTSVTSDLLACSIGCFESLTALLSGEAAAGWTHDELEEHLEERGVSCCGS
ncbi:hypothetical protein [Streptomyces sp. NPDC001315]|uniref:hypothetical protein n=1 Tax=Streptomyces sp. NPDC001315 TaxID=3364562 RepID=UPI0036AF5755